MMRSRFYGALIMAVTLVATLPDGALARPFNATEQGAFEFALGWWRVSAPPTCSSVTLEVGSVMTADRDAQATQPQLNVPPVPCTLTLNGYVHWDRQWEYLCATLIHETGHLLGFGHSDDPFDVMFYGGEVGFNVAPWVCYVEARRRFHQARLARLLSICPKKASQSPAERHCWEKARKSRAILAGQLAASRA